MIERYAFFSFNKYFFYYQINNKCKNWHSTEKKEKNISVFNIY